MFWGLISDLFEVLKKGRLKGKKGGPMGDVRGTIFNLFPRILRGSQRFGGGAAKIRASFFSIPCSKFQRKAPKYQIGCSTSHQI